MSQDESIFWDILSIGLPGKRAASILSGDEPPEKKPKVPMPRAHYLPQQRRLIEEEETDEEKERRRFTNEQNPLFRIIHGIPPREDPLSTISIPQTPKKKKLILADPSLGTPVELEGELERSSPRRLREQESHEDRSQKIIETQVQTSEDMLLSPPFAEELLSPENVEPVPITPMPYGYDLYRDLVVDDIHRNQIMNRVPMPPYKPIVNDEEECLPKQAAKEMFKISQETRYISYMTVYYLQHDYKPTLNYLHSHPNEYINYLKINFPITPPLFLTLAMLASLTIEDETSFVRYLAEKIRLHYETRPPSVIYFSFQIRGQRIYQQPGTLHDITVTSPVYCITFDQFEEEFYDRLLAWFDQLRLKEGNTDYDRFFTDAFAQYHIMEWNILYFNLVDSGGCHEIQHLSGKVLNYVESPRVIKNFCFFACLLVNPAFKLRYEYLKDDNERMARMRTDAGLLLNDQPVFFNQLADVCINLKVHLNIYTEYTSPFEDEQFHKWFKLEPHNSFYSDDPRAPVVYMLFVKRNGLGHFYIIKDLAGLLRLRCCRYCYQWFDRDKESYIKHGENCKPCPKCKRRLTVNHNCDTRNRQRKFPKAVGSKRKQKPWNEKVWFADFETFTKPDGTQQVYSAAIISIDALKDYKTKKIKLDDAFCAQFYGENCLSKFIDFILQIKGKFTLCFYNGSRFDYYFILNELIRRKIHVTLKKDEKGNTISIFNTKNIRFFDLLKFTLASLADACKSFKVPPEYCKTDFDHNKVFDLKSALEHKDEVVEYNIFDVISMGILYIILAQNFDSYWQVSTKEYVSLSHLSYDVWHKKYIPKEHAKALNTPNRKTYPFLRRALKGGRVYPGIPIYNSNLIELDLLLHHWKEQSPIRQKRICEHIKESPHQLKVYDFTSLYPWVAQHGPTFNEYLQGMFPVGNYEFLGTQHFDTHLKIFKDIVEDQILLPSQELLVERCFYEVDITCPNNLDVPFLLAHEKLSGKANKLTANLLPKTKQVYSGFMLKWACKYHKYKVTKIHDILKFGRLLPIMSSYMADLMKRKDECQKNSDEVGRNIFKQCANSYTGKHSEQCHEQDFEIHFEDKFVQTLDPEKVKSGLISIETFFNGLTPLAYYVGTPQEDVRKVYSKCPQIGVVILDYAKMIMDLIMRRLFLYDKNKLFYTDTDSLIVKYQTRLDDKSDMWGSEYGHLKDEFPDLTIVHGVFYAKKTYAFLALCQKKHQPVVMIKAKGAPQDKSQTVNRLYYITDLEEKCKKSKHSEDDLKHVMYYLVEENNIVDESTYIKYDWFMGLIFEPHKRILVHYGSFKKIFNDTRFLIDQDLTAFYIEKIKSHRTLNENDPWNLRKESDPKTLERVEFNGKTYPAGHLMDPFNIN